MGVSRVMYLKLTPVEVARLLRSISEEAAHIAEKFDDAEHLQPVLADESLRQRWLLLRLYVYRLEHELERLASDS